MSKLRKARLAVIAGLLSGVLGFGTFLFYRETWRGLWRYQFGAWRADEYVGKPLKGLRESLGSTFFIAMTRGDYRSVRREEVPPGLRVYKYAEGKHYRWFSRGVAINVGYILVKEGDGGEIIVKVNRGVEVDSL